MRRATGGCIALVAGLALGLAPGAAGQYGYELPQQQQPEQGGAEPAAEVGANGNVFTGGLSFTPPEVTVPLGGIVRWENTDFLVPHTSTEDHALWDLGGDYGGTPANPPGYGPGETVERPFEAGTHRYYCRVHPEDMRAVVAVAPELAVERKRVRSRRRTRRGRRRTVIVASVVARWSVAEPAEALAFDVQRRRAGSEDWIPFRDGTRETTGSFRSGRSPVTWEVRARLRRADDAEAATDWSPVAQIAP